MAQLTEAQQKALDAGTHVLDPVHGFVPVTPVSGTATTAEGVEVTPVQDAPSGNADFAVNTADVIKAQQAAVKETQKEQK